MNKRPIELIEELIVRAETLPVLDKEKLDGILLDAEMYFRTISERTEYKIDHYTKTMHNIFFQPTTFPSTDAFKYEVWRQGNVKLITLFKTIKNELELISYENLEKTLKDIPSKTISSKKVFVVQGHDNSMKLDVARTLEKLKLEAVILHERENDGRTVIEKFEQNSTDCGYAVVLLSPDDFAYTRDSSPEQGKYRARQNVILELGYFVGKISRKHVMALIKNDATGDLEVPSDLAGIVSTKYEDNNDSWKFELLKNLKSAGYNVDANDLL